MPLALTISGPLSWILLAALAVLLFLFGRSSAEKPPELPTKAQLEEMKEAAEVWFEATSAIAGWKAAIYGALGVVVGAIGGLGADWVATGHFASGEVNRLLKVGGCLLAFVVLVVFLLEKGKVVERIFKRFHRGRVKGADEQAPSPADLQSRG
jgi:hypothetical protein